MAVLLEEIEGAVWHVARHEFGAAAQAKGGIGRRIVELSQRYSALRAAPGLGAPNSPELLARLVFFTVADLPKVAFPLAELVSRAKLPEGRLRVLDVGAGVGTMSLGLLCFLRAVALSRPLEIDAVDMDSAALELMALVLEECKRRPALGTEVELALHPRDLARPVAAGAEPYELILLGSVLAELPPERALTLVLELLEALSPRGQLIIVEPALRQTARALHALRDQLLEKGAAAPFGPCTHAGPCPMLRDPSDWCHECRL